MTADPLHQIIEVHCPFCRAIFKRTPAKEAKSPLRFCAYCGATLKVDPEKPVYDVSSVFIKEHAPNKEDVQGAIGQYVLLRSIAKGGMGEVFLAFDTISGRQVALKRIRPDFINTPALKQRFLKEARITSQLIHPSIIPIYTIHINGDLVYYTMPYVQGTTLRQLFRTAMADDEAGRESPLSITAFVRMFLSIAQAIAYAHSRGILHRDIKPENIIVGPYGEVIILDWGLTKLIEESEEASLRNLPERESEYEVEEVHLTKVGKLVGTVSYMAPERSKGSPASIQTDIYALGVILYQILTLTMPFRRKNMSAFLDSVDKEQFIPPETRSPYRDVPRALSELTRRCLDKDPAKRIQSCDEIVSHVENFLEGKSEWYFVQSLNIDKQQDWQVQENILFSEYTSLFKQYETSDWYRLMISQQSFSDTLQIKLNVTLQPGSHGLGILFAVPSEKERQAITDGYCLWLATEGKANHGTVLLRSCVIVAEATSVTLSYQKLYEIVIEKTDQTFVLYIDGQESFRHVSHIPIIGSHVGLLVKDNLFSLSVFHVSEGSQNIMVNCLAVPDAFLATKAYEKAYISYNRLAELFAGRAEGREALFRAGIALLEHGRQQTDPAQRDRLFNKALSQFHRLRATAGAPLEYLGKAFVYQATREYEEEAKCFELAFRRLQHHPYLKVLHEQLIVRLHESLRNHRLAASHFIALAMRYVPQELALPSTRKLLSDIKEEWEWPHYFPEKKQKKESDNKDLMLLALSFWLRLPHLTLELLETLLVTPVLPRQQIETALLTLKALENIPCMEKALEKCRQVFSNNEQKIYESLFFFSEESEGESLARITATIQAHDDVESLHIRAAIVILDRILQKSFLLKEIPKISQLVLLLQAKAPKISALSARIVELLLTLGLFDQGFALLQAIDSVEIIDEKHPLFFLKGCYLAQAEGEHSAFSFFQSAKEILYPNTWAIAAYVISGKIHLRPKGWFPRAYAYEIETLERHLKLFSTFASPSWRRPSLPLSIYTASS